MTLERLIQEYRARTPRSAALYARALRVMPGGNSRTTTFFDPHPFYAARGEGARIWDVDGVERLDCNGNYTSLIRGHAPPAVLKHVVVLPWNAPEACEKILEREGDALAALLVDPLLGVGGILPPAPGFLERLREVTARLGILLTPRGLGCCSAAMAEADVDRFVEAVGGVLERDGK